MSRYQREVAEMDRRHSLAMRCASFVGAAVLIMVALWSAGLPPTELLARAEQWLASLRPPPEQIPAQPQSLPAPASAVDSQVARAVPSAESLPGTDSSVSKLAQPLYLLGTSPGRHVREGTALIGTSIENPQTYSAGALLANGAQLAEIHRNHVVLKRGTQMAKLPVYQRSQASNSHQTLSDLLEVGGGTPPLPAAESTQPEMLTDYMRPSPIYDGEMLTGYQVYPGQRSGVFSLLGLQPGDVITAINDVPFTDTTQAIEQLEQILHGVAVVATVVRKSKTERLTLDGAAISAYRQQSGNIAAVSGAPLLPESS